jgi:hypothetical protein
VAVLNSNRIIDACGNTAANPYAKKCVIVQEPPKPLSDTEVIVLEVIGVTLLLIVTVIGVMLFRRK